MEKYIPYAKLSKKEKQKRDRENRNTWGSFSPVTRKPENSKAYNRRKAQNWKHDSNSVPFVCFINHFKQSRKNRLLFPIK